MVCLQLQLIMAAVDCVYLSKTSIENLTEWFWTFQINQTQKYETYPFHTLQEIVISHHYILACLNLLIVYPNAQTNVTFIYLCIWHGTVFLLAHLIVCTLHTLIQCISCSTLSWGKKDADIGSSYTNRFMYLRLVHTYLLNLMDNMNRFHSWTVLILLKTSTVNICMTNKEVHELKFH